MIKEKLTRIQNELKVPKSRYNQFGNFYYRSAEDIEEAVKPILAKYDVSLHISNDIVPAGDRVYVKSTATLSDDDDSITISSFAREPEEKKGMDDSQITGAAVSYANKYCLGNLFLINDSADADSMNNNKEEKDRLAELKDFCSKKKAEEGADIKQLKAFYNFYAKKDDKTGLSIAESMKTFNPEKRYEAWLAKAS